MAIQPGLGAQGIAANWGSAPELRAIPLGEMVKAVLADKLAREKQLRDAVSGTIGNVRGEMQSNAYLEAAKAAGIIPQDFDAGGLGGAQLGSTLAKQIEAQKLAALRGGLIEAQTQGALARAGKEQTIADYIKQHGTTPGRGGGGDGSSEPETRWDAQGREWRPGPGGRWILITPPRGTSGNTDIAKAVKEQMSVQDQFDLLEKDRKKQEAEDIAAGRANVPFKQSDLYNLERNRLEQLKKIPGMPSTEPQGIPQRPPAETGDALPTSKPVPSATPSDQVGGHAPGYGVPPVGTIRNGYRFKGGDPKDQTNWEPI